MKKYLAPLGTFLVGQLILLFAFLFFPAMGNATTQLASDTAGIASHFWGWTWAVSFGRFALYLAIEGATLWATGKAFIEAKDE